MHYQVDVAWHMNVIGHIAAQQPEIRVRNQVRDISRNPGEEIVQAEDLDT